MKSMFSRRLLAKALVALPAAALTLAVAPEARASEFGDTVANVFFGGLTIIVTGTVFTIHDVGVLAQGESPSFGFSVAESVVMTPQSLILGGLSGDLHAHGERSGALSIVLLVPTIWTTTLATHGIWSAAAPNADRGTVYGVSWAVGANYAFTTGAVGALFHKRRVPPMAFGIAEMVGTMPTILVGGAQLAYPASRDRGAWTALTAWSGALFVHGAATTIVDALRARKKDGDLDSAANDRKPWRGFAPRFHFAPTMVSDGVLRAPGIGVSGVF